MKYATLEELAEYMGVEVAELPDYADRLLDRASEFVDYVSMGNIDHTKTSHMDSAKLATCAQVEWWEGSGDWLGVSAVLAGFSLGSFSASMKTGSGLSAELMSGLRICPRAHQVLFMEGLLFRGVERR